MHHCKYCGRLLAADKLRKSGRYRNGVQRYACPDCERGRRDRRKASAQSRLRYAVRQGRIVRPAKCEYGCRSPVQAHHPDYSKPYKVRWLCPRHHALQHPPRPFPRRYVYRHLSSDQAAERGRRGAAALTRKLGGKDALKSYLRKLVS